MNKPLDELYFVWLYSQVGSVNLNDSSSSYWRLLKLLFTKEFIWIVPNDDNRAEDGRDLRQEFIQEESIKLIDDNWLRLGCSVLELLIGVSRRLAFEAEKTPKIWFWRLMTNLGLNSFNDEKRFSEKMVDDILDSFIWRTYRPDGFGGLFPLDTPSEDQRDVEIWYQLSAYLLERSY